MKSLDELLRASASFHHHLCPRQVLGVRMGLLAGRLLGLNLPQRDKRLLTIVETDGCAADGVAVATGCWVGKRTLRVEDLGKVAATFVDTVSGLAVRLAPCNGVRRLAAEYAPEAQNKWQAQLLGYQRMPEERLLSWQRVALATPVRDLISRPGARAVCQACGEEIINEREVAREGVVLCRACAYGAYYTPLSALSLASSEVEVKLMTDGASVTGS
jgi:formylmethanofuran dehydrogenase subunit E